MSRTLILLSMELDACLEAKKAAAARRLAIDPSDEDAYELACDEFDAASSNAARAVSAFHNAWKASTVDPSAQVTP